MSVYFLRTYHKYATKRVRMYICIVYKSQRAKRYDVITETVNGS